MNCAQPTDSAALADYWLGILPESEEHEVEEHLFTCDECGRRLREVIAMAEGLRRLSRAGSLMMIVSDKFVKRAEEQGLRVREYAPPAGGSVQCTVSLADDLLLGHLAADLSGASQVDLCICNRDGIETFRMRDIPVRPDASAVTFQQPIHYAKAAPSETMIARLVAIEETGERRIADFRFIHTRTIPGPAGE